MRTTVETDMNSRIKTNVKGNTNVCFYYNINTYTHTNINIASCTNSKTDTDSNTSANTTTTNTNSHVKTIGNSINKNSITNIVLNVETNKLDSNRYQY